MALPGLDPWAIYQSWPLELYHLVLRHLEGPAQSGDDLFDFLGGLPSAT